MKRFLCILFLSASVACGQTSNVKVDANGNVLHSQLQNTATNPTGVVNYATGKLMVNGVAVTTGGGGSAPPFSDAGAIIKGSVDPLKLLRFEVDRLEYTGPTAVMDLGGNFYTETAFTVGASFSTNGNFTTIGDFFSGGVVELSNDFTTDGAFPITLRAPAAVDIFLPPTGTVATQEYGATTWQPKDSDLTSIADLADDDVMVYRQTEGVWLPVDIGNGLEFASGKLAVLRDFSEPSSSRTSAATLDLTGLARSEIDVTGSTTITSITGLADTEEVLLRFPDGLTLTHGASLQLKGGVDTIAPANSWGRFRRDGAVVTAIDFQTPEGYKTDTFSNIFMLPGANIGYADQMSPYFDVGRSNVVDNPESPFLRFTQGDGTIAIRRSDLSAGATLSIASLTATRAFKFLDYAGQFAVVEDTDFFGGSARFDGSILTEERTYGLQDRDITFAGIDGETFTDATINGLDVSGALDLTGIITPPALTADVNNYAPTGFATASTIRVTDDGLGTYIMTGLAGGTDGRTVFLHYVGTGTFTLSPYDAASAEANQFVYASGSIVLNPDQIIVLQYDAIALKWRTDWPVIYATGWGGIGGTLSDQSDLQSALDAKLVRDASFNLAANNFLDGYATTVSAAGTTTLTVASAQTQYVTGATTQILKLPVVSTLALGHSFRVVNNSTGLVTVNSSGNNAIKILAAGTSSTFTCILITGTTAASWDAIYFGFISTTGKRLNVTNSMSFVGTDATTMTFPATSASIARTDAAQTFTGVQTMTSPAITTPVITGLASGNGVSETATASTLVARDANGDSTTGNIISSVAGKGLQLQSGTGARAGNATLVGGTVTVTNTTVNSTNDILLMTRKTSGGTIGMALTYTLSNGASFTMNSDNILDTSTISYMLVKVN